MVSFNASGPKKEDKITKKGLKVTKEEFLSLKPMHSPFVSILKRESDHILLEINIKQFKKRTLRGKIIPSPDHRKIRLDELGMYTFELCNGNNTVKQIIKKFQERFKLTFTETETSVTKYLTMLNSRHLIGWQIPKELVEKSDAKQEKVENIIFK